MDPNIKQVVIKCPEGYEVDYENSTFECIKFKPIKNELPKTWEEFCKLYPAKEGEAYLNNAGKVSRFSSGYRDFLTDKNVLPSEGLAEAMLALCQLIQLRDCYNDGWEPDWANSSVKKYCIYPNAGSITTGALKTVNEVLFFKTEELIDKFLKNFRDLIEVAKPLL